MADVRENLKKVLAEIAQAESDAKRAAGSVRLLAVSKTFPPEDIRAAFDGGQRMFGENRVAELETKVSALPSAIEWHLIGHLQSNKTAKAVEFASWIHSVDSEKLVRHIECSAAEREKKVGILLEVNISGEESKFGLRGRDAVFRCAELALAMPHIRLAGLMTMAEFGAAESVLRSTFAGLRSMRDSLAESFGTPLPELSMGMSSDFRSAIAEGATLVRIGTAVFGGR